MQSYGDTATEDWHWFEEVVSYANAKLPHALILSGRCLNAAPLLETGLKALRWLVKVQTSANRRFPAHRLERILSTRQGTRDL